MLNSFVRTVGFVGFVGPAGLIGFLTFVRFEKSIRSVRVARFVSFVIVTGYTRSAKVLSRVSVSLIKLCRIVSLLEGDSALIECFSV